METPILRERECSVCHPCYVIFSICVISCLVHMCSLLFSVCVPRAIKSWFTQLRSILTNRYAPLTNFPWVIHAHKPKTISFVSFESLKTSLWYNCTVLDLIPSPIITYFDMQKTSQCWTQSQKCCHIQYIGHNCKRISHQKNSLGLHRLKRNRHYSKQNHIITRQSLKNVICLGTDLVAALIMWKPWWPL